MSGACSCRAGRLGRAIPWCMARVMQSGGAPGKKSGACVMCGEGEVGAVVIPACQVCRVRWATRAVRRLRAEGLMT